MERDQRQDEERERGKEVYKTGRNRSLFHLEKRGKKEEKPASGMRSSLIALMFTLSFPLPLHLLSTRKRKKDRERDCVSPGCIKMHSMLVFSTCLEGWREKTENPFSFTII